MTTLRYVLTVEPDDGYDVITEQHGSLASLWRALAEQWDELLDGPDFAELVDGYPLECDDHVISVTVEVVG